MSKFAERLKNSLNANHISQAELAKRIGLTRDAISKYCTGRREPSLDVLMLICKTLDESADYMLGLED
jgi:transcriptional regulator with XRE-family HTH domain